MTESYEELIQGYYFRYQNGSPKFNQYRNCFTDITEYQDMVSGIYIKFLVHPTYKIRYESGQITPDEIHAKFQIAIRNGSVDSYRERKSQSLEPLDSYSSYESTWKHQMGRKDLEANEMFRYAHNILRAAGLTSSETAIFLDIHYCGKTQFEVANIHGLTDRTIRNKLTKAFMKLRRLTGKL